MSVLVWVAVGLLGGAAAGWVRHRRGRLLAGDMVVGVLGAILGGFLASATLGLDITGIDWTTVLVAALGAALLIVILHTLGTADIYA